MASTVHHAGRRLATPRSFWRRVRPAIAALALLLGIAPAISAQTGVPEVEILLPSPLIVAATSPAGAAVTLEGTVSHTAGMDVTYYWNGPFDNVMHTVSPPFLPGNATQTLQVPIGEHLIRLFAFDDNDQQAEASVIVRVVSGAAVTGDGTYRPPPLLFGLSAADPQFTPAVSVTVTGVNRQGGLGLAVRNGPPDDVTAFTPPVPPGQQLGSPPFYYDLFTSATFSSARVCIDLTGVSFAAPPDNLSLRYSTDDATWTAVSNQTLTGNELCGTSSALGTFAIFHPAVPANAAVTIAGSGTSRESGGVIIDADSPALGSPAGVFGTGIVFDEPQGLLYWTDFAKIRRADLNQTPNMMRTIGGTGGFDEPQGGDDGVDARNAVIPNPKQLALDVAGNLYLAVRCVVRRIDRATNIITTVAGNGECRHADGPALTASLDGAAGLGFDAVGNLLITEGFPASRVRRLRNGQLETIAGNGTEQVVPGSALSSGLPAIGSLAVAPNGDVYMAGNRFDSTARRYVAMLLKLSGNTLSLVNACALTESCSPTQKFDGDGGPVASAYFRQLKSVAVESLTGDVLVTDDVRIRRISASDGIIRTVVGHRYSGSHFSTENFGLSSNGVTAAAIAIDPRGGFFFVRTHDETVRHVGVGGMTGTAAADLAIVVSAPAAVTIGSQFAYTVTIRNNGPAPATGVVWTMPATSGLSVYNVSSPSGINCPLAAGASGVSCPIGDLADGAQLAFVVSAQALSVSPLSTTFSVVGNEDPAPANNSRRVDVTVSKARLSVEVHSSTTTSYAGDEVRFTATLTGGVDLTGDIWFYDGTTLIGTVDVTGALQVSTTTLSVGTHQITAVYQGDQQNESAESEPATHTVLPARVPSAIALTTSPNPALAGEDVTITATVSGASPTGNVVFGINGNQFRIIAISNGQATTTVQLAQGLFRITADYAGDQANGAAPTEEVLQVVTTVATSGTAVRSIAEAVINNIVLAPDDKIDGGLAEDSLVMSVGQLQGDEASSSTARGTLPASGPEVGTSSSGVNSVNGIQSKIGQAGARAIAYAAYVNPESTPQARKAHIDLDGRFAGQTIGHGIAAVYVFTANEFLTTIANNGGPQYLLGDDSLAKYEAGNEATLSLRNLFPLSALKGYTPLSVRPAAGTRQVEQRIEVAFSVDPGELVIVVFDLMTYQGPGGATNFSGTLKPAPVFFTDASGNPAPLLRVGPSTPTPAPANSLTIAPARTTTSLTSSATLTATVRTASGAPVADALVIFEIVGGPNTQPLAPAVTDADGIATFAYGGAAIGTDQIVAQIGALQSNVAEVTWTAGPLDRISISPSSATIAAGRSQSFTTQAFDAFNNERGDVTAETMFTIAPDGSCDGPICTPSAAGVHTVTATYEGRTATASLNVTGVTLGGFTFQGFFAPIDMSTPSLQVWNTVKAGRVVPVKWRLTQSGAPVSDPGSFAGLFSQSVDCSAGAGSIEAAIEQLAAGHSGLQYDGDGNWQFNWRTASAAKGSCMAVVVTFSDGTMSPVAYFKLK
jgi:uncharacterized repeat protein (TIGR01451 family)